MERPFLISGVIKPPSLIISAVFLFLFEKNEGNQQREKPRRGRRGGEGALINELEEETVLPGGLQRIKVRLLKGLRAAADEKSPVLVLLG